MSAPVSGDFSCAELLEIKARASAIFADDVQSVEYKANVNSALAVLQNQTAQLGDLQNPAKDRTVKVYWVDDCDSSDPDDCTSDCTVDGDPIGTNCQEYTLDTCFEKTLSITEKVFRTSNLEREEVVAKQLLKKLKLMDEYWAKKVIAFLNTNSGVNAYAGPYTYAAGVTTIPAPAWNPDLFGYLALALAKNKLNAGVMLSGINLWQSYWKMDMELTKPDGTSNANKLNSLGKPYFDIHLLDSTVGANTTFLFNGNSVALITKAYYSGTPRELKANNVWQQRYTIASPSLPGVTYDVIYTVDCVAGDGSGDVQHSWKIVSTGGIFLNPLGCDEGRTGILQMQCG